MEVAQSFALERNVPDAFYKSMLNSFNEAVQYVSVNGLLHDFKSRILKIYQITQDENWLHGEGFSRALDLID